MGGESRQVCDKVGMGSVAGEGRDVGGEVGGEGGGGGGQVLISHSREVTDRGRSAYSTPSITIDSKPDSTP